MKIVVTGTRGIPDVMGGVETHCEELFPRIAEKGYDVTIIRRRSYIKDHLKEWHGVKLIDLPAPRLKPFEAITHTFLAVLKAKKIGADVLHIHAIGPALLVPFARLLGMKVVFTSHGPDYNRETWGLLAKMMLRLGERWGAKYANEVVVISHVIDNQFKKMYHRYDCHVIHNGVSSPQFCENPEYFEELGIQKGKYILGMCRFVPEKNLHHLVEAYSYIKDKYPDIKLVIAGDATFEDDYSIQLKKDAAKHGVILTGFVKGNKLHSLLTNARCYVLPSSHEGLPISLLEAMSYKLPVIISDIPPHIEVGIDKECYFPLGNVEILAKKLQENIEADYHHVEYDMKKYNWNHIADQLCEVYNHIGNKDK